MSIEVLKSIVDFFASHAAILGILSAIIGFVAKHNSDRRLSSYEARLSFVRDQLKELYGPLFLLSESNDKVWGEFRQQFRSGREMFDAANPLSVAEKAEYVRWLEVAFVPCNEKMRRTIERSAHLFIDGSAPSSVLDLLAHFDALNIILSKLKDGSDDNVFPVVIYPKDFGAHIRNDYAKVVQRHARLTSGWNA